MRDVLAVLKLSFALNMLKIPVEHLPVLGWGFVCFSDIQICALVCASSKPAHFYGPVTLYSGWYKWKPP